MFQFSFVSDAVNAHEREIMNNSNGPMLNLFTRFAVVIQTFVLTVFMDVQGIPHAHRVKRHYS